ncbi:hypothetical protein ES703_40443 [subsurface metagenome]
MVYQNRVIFRKKFLSKGGKTMDIIKRRVAVTVIGLIVLCTGTTCKKDGIDS